MGTQNNMIRSFFGTHFLYLPEIHNEPSMKQHLPGNH